MNARIQDTIAGCSLHAGASIGELQLLQTTLGRTLPADYLDLLRFSNGFEGEIGENYVQMWPSESVRRCGVHEDASFLVFIGSDGAGEGYAYDMRQSPPPIINVPFLVEEQLIRVLGGSVLEFLERLARAPLFD